MDERDLRYSDFFDVMNEGFILIDQNGIIKTYNEKAKEILSIKRECSIGHKSGQLCKGDIVILAITSFGNDDSGLRLEDIKKIGINLKAIEKGSTLLAIGVYGDSLDLGISKVKGPRVIMDALTLEKSLKGLKINVKVDYVNRNINIVVNDREYETYYDKYFGHGVIIDGTTNEVKFFQHSGYTAWNEEMKLILDGESFSEKKVGVNEIEVINRHILNNHEENKIIGDLLLCAQGVPIFYKGKQGNINGISVIYGIQGIKREGKLVGAVLLFVDMTRLENIENERNLAYKKLEKVEAKLEDKKVYQMLFPEIVGSSNGIIEVKKLAFKISKSHSNVLILGESGTGKSILARCIHEVSADKKKPFIHVNCNSIPENLLESELFGYEKGAFTGANIKGKKGYFEIANGGTIFLDEIGDISKNMQIKLLQVIQNKKFYRVGGDKEVNVDVRIIAATNRNLENEVKKGNFRADLYYRINVFPITILPLRERKSDIYELVEYLIPKISERVGIELKRISGEALNKIMKYSWPGNVRELENVLERAVNLSDDLNILSEHINIKNEKKNEHSDVNYLKPLKQTLNEVENKVIRSVLKYANGNKKMAMEILKIKKTSFYDKIKKMNSSDITEK